MIELTKDELLAAPADVWHRVSYTVNHHKWLLEWYRSGDDGEFVFSFVSSRARRYTYYSNGGKVVCAEVVAADGVNVASYYESWGDKPERLDSVLRLTPTHVIDRLVVLLYATR